MFLWFDFFFGSLCSPLHNTGIQESVDVLLFHILWFHVVFLGSHSVLEIARLLTRGGGQGSRPKKMYGQRLGDGVEYHLMSPMPRR